MSVSLCDPELSCEPERISVMRSCSRCGQEFQAIGGGYVCAACRKPKQIRDDRILGRPLAARERQIVDLIRQAKPNKEIAFDLHLSEGTVKVYLCSIFRKLGVQNRTGLALWAIDQERPGA